MVLKQLPTIIRRSVFVSGEAGVRSRFALAFSGSRKGAGFAKDAKGVLLGMGRLGMSIAVIENEGAWQRVLFVS